MANPRRPTALHSTSLTINTSLTPAQSSPPVAVPASGSLFSSVVLFLKRPLAFPFLLCFFVLLTWIALRLQQHHTRVAPVHRTPSLTGQMVDGRQSLDADLGANLVRFSSVEFPSKIFKDKRGWLLNPVPTANEAGISGGALSCISVHVGEIRPGGVRGNHRHHTCNETFIIWGAKTKFRLEKPSVEGNNYSEVTVGIDEVAVASSPRGTAHALINVDPVRSTFFLGCQDCAPNYNSSATDMKIWSDI